MRRTALLFALFGMALLSIVPAGASPSIYQVEFGLVSHTGGGGTFHITGAVTGNETGAVGTVVYDHPYHSSYPWSATLQVDAECILVVPSTNTNFATDYNVLVAGPLTVVEDSDNKYGGWDWAGFVYAPDESGYGSPGARPINAQLFNGTPSCVLEDFFWRTTPPGVWTGGGYFDSGAFINVAVDPDTDGDGVLDTDDLCPATTLNDPPDQLRKNRFAADAEGMFVDVNGTESGFSVIDTFGCDEDQIIEIAGLGKGHDRFGITTSAILDFMTMNG